MYVIRLKQADVDHKHLFFCDSLSLCVFDITVLQTLHLLFQDFKY